VAQARVTAAQSQLATFSTALDAFEVDNGYYPRGSDGLLDLSVEPQGAASMALAVTVTRRLDTFPQVPTVAETIPGFESMGWMALMAPPGTPEPIAKKISDDLRTILTGPDPETVILDVTESDDVDLIVIPGGFSYGDYLRAGAIAARSPIMDVIRERAARGVRILGVCNGFQILTEAGLLPGVLMRNASLKFVCREVKLEVVNADTTFTRGYAAGQVIRCPVAHHDGNYFADPDTLARIEDNGQVAFRYADGTNPNGSIHDIAGVFNADKSVLGLMPHPENLIESAHGGIDGRGLFTGLLDAVA
jgi:phosphoribosylformylglycinamidine synthase